MPKLAPRVPQITSQQEMLSFLRDDLHWPIPDGVLADELTFDWHGDDLRLSDAASGKFKDGIIRQFRSLVTGQPWGIFFVEFADMQVYRTALRQVLRGLVPNRRRDASLQAWQHENLLFICATVDYERITFAHFRGDKVQRAKLTTFGWRRGSTYLRTLLEHNLPKLAWPEDNGANEEGWLAQWAKAFDKEPLTKEFFKRFEAAIEALKDDLEKNQKLASAQAYSRAQLLLERLLFLYFLQNRGWLDQKRDYLLSNFVAHRGKPQEHSYYADFLERLFFTLSTPPDFKGPGSGLRLPGVPFLNGGLFDDDEFAQTETRKKENPPLRIRNATFAFVFDELLEVFNFTVREDTPLNQDVAVDPEMLGKVFESIVLHAEAADPDAVAPDKRKATGSYYTPRIVVHFICRESLCQYLLQRLPPDQDWNRRLRAAMDILALDGLDADELALLKTLLSPAEGKLLAGLIENLKCCDPSVGSGAFPVGLLHELLNFRRVVEAAANGYVDPVRKHGNQWVHDTKAQIVENCLYGVDLQQQAIEICRLRLWLSLVVDYDLGCDPLTAARPQFLNAIRGISQLPNLEMNFRRGDSLLDMISGVPIRVDSGAVTAYRDEVNAIQKLGHDLHKARSADKKKKLRLEILRRRLDLTQSVLELERKQHTDNLANQKLTLFGAFGFDENASEAENRRRVEGEIQQLNEALQKVTADRKELEKLAATPLAADFYPRLRRLEGADFDSPFNFVWQIDFAEIFTPKPAATLAGEMILVNQAQTQKELVATSKSSGGFDVMVGNPPFVTARNPIKRELYRARWARVCHGKFLLICPFFDLSFGHLRPDGQLGFIVSNAFAKREFGQPLVEDFFPTVDLQKVMDCSGLLFPGHGTPTCIVFGAQRKPVQKTLIRVAATLPGGGDLRTPPEESPLWHALAAQHDNPSFSNEKVVISDRSRKELGKWPWNFDSGATPTREAMDTKGVAPLRDFLSADVGFMFVIGRNDIFMLSPGTARRLRLSASVFKALNVGDEIRNYELRGQEVVIFPYQPDTLKLLKFAKASPEGRYFACFEQELSDRPTFGGTFGEDGRAPYQYHQLPVERAKNPKSIAFAQISTHLHLVFDGEGSAFNEKAPLLKLPPKADENEHHLVTGICNSAAALFWFKQVCFNKGAGEEEHRDRFEYAGGKVQQLPVPTEIADALRGKSAALTERLTTLSRACWERGRELPSLALRKLFETTGEAYHAWNAALPGHVPPHAQLPAPFSTTAELRKAFTQACTLREKLRAEMIAWQEEMDWLVYRAYGLLGREHSAAPFNFSRPTDLKMIRPLDETQRAFRFWAAADGDFDQAVALIPTDWSAERQELWQGRLATIRDNEHIRRIEAPVYKRRWDEQWKVGNRWTAGPAAYAQELADAFRGWLAERAEWHLEEKAKGGPLGVDAWCAALWNDARVQAAWPVVADAITRVELHKIELGGKKPKKQPEADASPAAFAKYFRAVVAGESVPDGIPPAVPWAELEKKMTVPKQAMTVRGKLNVPRERFRQRKDGSYVWAGKE